MPTFSYNKVVTYKEQGRRTRLESVSAQRWAWNCCIETAQESGKTRSDAEAIPDGKLFPSLGIYFIAVSVKKLQAGEYPCVKGLFDEKYNNNPKHSLIERRLLPCLSFFVPGSALCEYSIGAASSVGVVKTKSGLAAHKLDRTVCLCAFLFFHTK